MDGEGTKTQADVDAMPSWAAEFVKEIREDSAETRKVVNDLGATVLAFDTRLKAVEAEPVIIPRYSGRVAALEQTDVSVNTRLENLEKATAAQNVTLAKILGNPEVRRVLQTLAGFVIALATLGTWMTYQKLSALQARAEERQPAPSVTVVPVFMPVTDAGGSDAHP